jgi:hypothetical protein
MAGTLRRVCRPRRLWSIRGCTAEFGSRRFNHHIGAFHCNETPPPPHLNLHLSSLFVCAVGPELTDGVVHVVNCACDIDHTTTCGLNVSCRPSNTWPLPGLNTGCESPGRKVGEKCSSRGQPSRGQPSRGQRGGGGGEALFATRNTERVQTNEAKARDG